MPSKTTRTPRNATKAAKAEAEKKQIDDFLARRNAARDETAKHYAGLSQAVHRSGKSSPVAVYLQSYFSGNGHAPATLTTRDETAALALARAAGMQAGVTVNPGSFGGDKSACGIRARGHGFIIAVDATDKPTSDESKAVALAVTEKCIATAKRIAK